MRTYIDNVSDIVEQGNVDVQPRGDEPGSLEEVVIILLPGRCELVVARVALWTVEATALIDDGDILRNVVVEPIEHNEQYAYAGRHPQQAFVGKAVRLELTILEGTDGVLHGLVAAVQRGKI